MNSAEALRRVRLMQTHQELLWRPTPGFKEFSSDRHRWLLCRAANQCGKSMAAAHKIAMRMIREPGLRARAYAPNREMSRQVLQRYMHSFLKHYLKKDNYTEGRASHLIRSLYVMARSYNSVVMKIIPKQAQAISCILCGWMRCLNLGISARPSRSHAPLWAGDLHPDTR